MDEVIFLLNEIKELSNLLIPIFILTFVNYLLIGIRFVFWFIDLRKSSELETYKRLKAKYEKDNEVH